MYRDKTVKQLLEIEQHCERLTFESQLGLKDALQRSKAPGDRKHLDEVVVNKTQEINSLVHLKDLGFQAKSDGDYITVTRTNKAIVTDIIAVVVGFIVFLVGVYGAVSLFLMFTNGNELNVFSLGVNAFLTSLLFVGFKFFSGLKRLFDYVGFELLNHKGEITLKKRFDIKLEEVKGSPLNLSIATDGDLLVLEFGDNEVFVANSQNIIQKMTMKALLHRLQDK